jgi:hypothetical protein
MKGVISKIDFEKAYKKVNYSFLSQTLIRFSPKMAHMGHSFMCGHNVGRNKINDDVGHYFQTRKKMKSWRTTITHLT